MRSFRCVRDAIEKRPLSDGIAATPAASSSFRPAGPAQGMEIVFRVPASNDAVPYYLYVPTRLRGDRRPLIAVHGISRNALRQARTFAPLAERSGRLLVAPLFSTVQCRRYQKVVVDDCRSDSALLQTLDDVTERTGLAVERVDLCGFSGGSQFSHRFAMLHPDRVGRLALASAGWYTFPTIEDPFPYGIAENSPEGRRIAAALDRFLRIPVLVLVGERDVERDAVLRKGARVDPRQGRSRVERARRWAEAVRQAAQARRVPSTVAFQLLPGCGHDFAECAARAGLAGRVVAWFDSEKL